MSRLFNENGPVQVVDQSSLAVQLIPYGSVVMEHGHGHGQSHPGQSRGHEHKIFMSGTFGQISYDIILYITCNLYAT